MSEEATQEPEGLSPLGLLTPTDETEAQWREAMAMRERVTMEQIRANERVALAAADTQNRVIALMQALTSFGLGGNVIQAPMQRPEADDILKRAGAFYEFVRGGDRPNVVPLRPVEEQPAYGS